MTDTSAEKTKLISRSFKDRKREVKKKKYNKNTSSAINNKEVENTVVKKTSTIKERVLPIVGHEDKPKKYSLVKDKGSFEFRKKQSSFLFAHQKIKGLTVDNDGKPYLFSKFDPYFVNENGILIERNWNDLIELNNFIDLLSIIKMFVRDELTIIFQALYNIEVNTRIALRNPSNSGQSFKAETAKKVLSAIKRSVNKYNKTTSNRLTAIVAIDSLFAIGNDNGPLKVPSQIDLIKQLTENKRGIIVLGKNTYNSNWWKEQENNILSEVRVLSDERIPLRKDNHKLFFNRFDAIAKSKEDYREIYVIGGESTFKEYWQEIDNIYMFVHDHYDDTFTKFFTEMEMYNWETLEVVKIDSSKTEDDFDSTLCHERAIKGRQKRWKETTLKQERILQEKLRITQGKNTD